MRLLALLIVIWLQLAPLAAFAQSTPRFPMRVTVSSAFIRAAPDENADAVSSVYAETALNAVGRNIDGTWIQVEYPDGWINRALVVFSFDIGALPLTDLTTGVTGAIPVIDSGFTLQTIDDAPFRAIPERSSAILATVPMFAALPALERTPDNQWIAVNYRGTVGWLPQHLTRQSFALSELPISPAYADNARYPAVIEIPPEVQLAQLNRLVDWITPKAELSRGIAAYWRGLLNGEVLECRPYAPDQTYYPVTPDDLIELPELRQQERFLRQAIDDLNAALAPTSECGIVVDVDLRGAYARALNANAIFRLVLNRMESLRPRIG